MSGEALTFSRQILRLAQSFSHTLPPTSFPFLLSCPPLFMDFFFVSYASFPSSAFVCPSQFFLYTFLLFFVFLFSFFNALRFPSSCALFSLTVLAFLFITSIDYLFNILIFFSSLFAIYSTNLLYLLPLFSFPFLHTLNFISCFYSSLTSFRLPSALCFSAFLFSASFLSPYHTFFPCSP